MCEQRLIVWHQIKDIINDLLSHEITKFDALRKILYWIAYANEEERVSIKKWFENKVSKFDTNLEELNQIFSNIRIEKEDKNG